MPSLWTGVSVCVLVRFSFEMSGIPALHGMISLRQLHAKARSKSCQSISPMPFFTVWCWAVYHGTQPANSVLSGPRETNSQQGRLVFFWFFWTRSFSPSFAQSNARHSGGERQQVPIKQFLTQYFYTLPFLSQRQKNKMRRWASSRGGRPINSRFGECMSKGLISGLWPPDPLRSLVQPHAGPRVTLCGGSESGPWLTRTTVTATELPVRK